MENAINRTSFLTNFNHLLKGSIHSNKGIPDSNLLDRAIKVFNRFKQLELDNAVGGKEIGIIIKRINLIMKSDGGNRIDLKEKKNQLRLFEFEPHQSVLEDRMEEFIVFSEGVNFFPGVPVSFILKSSKFQEISWQNLRLLFYFSQIILGKGRTEVIADAAQHVEDIIMKIDELETKLKLDSILQADEFLSSVLIGTDQEENIRKARAVIGEKLKSKGLDEHNPIIKLVDTITNKLGDFDFSNPNVFKEAMDVAKDVVSDISRDMNANNMSSLMEGVNYVQEIVAETANDENNRDLIPPMFRTFIDQIQRNQMNAANGVNQDSSQLMSQAQQILGQTNDPELQNLIKQMGSQPIDGFNPANPTQSETPSSTPTPTSTSSSGAKRKPMRKLG